jgi:hypothetical protein
MLTLCITQAKWSITQIHAVHDTNLPASVLNPLSSVAKVTRGPEGREQLLASVPHSLQQQHSTTSSSSPLLLPIASPSFVDPLELALLEVSCRAAAAAAAATGDSNCNWSSTIVMTEPHASNPPPPPPLQPRTSRSTTLAERWMSL